MKIVVINGSPRKGNTDELVKAVLKGSDGHEIDYFDLREKTVAPCIACNACEKLNAHCKDQDDTNDILNAIRKSDMIVFATPVYWWGVSAQLKAVLDKFYAFHSEGYKKYKKKIGLIKVGGASTDAKQYQIITDQFDCIANFLEWEIVFDENFSAYAVGDILQQTDALKKCETLLR